MSGSVKSEKTENDRAWKQLQNTWKATNAGLAEDLAKATTTIAELEGQIEALNRQLTQQNASFRAEMQNKNKDIHELQQLLRRVVAVLAIVRNTDGIAFIFEKDQNFKECASLLDDYVVRHAREIGGLYPDNIEATKTAAETATPDVRDNDADDERGALDPDATPRPAISSSKLKGRLVERR